MSQEKTTEAAAWETMVVNVPMNNPAGAKTILDGLGRERWELVSVAYVQPLTGITGVAFLKRAVREA